MIERQTAGQIHNKLIKDTTKYNVDELAHYMCEDIPTQLFESIKNYKDIIDEPEFCVIRQIASDPIIASAKRNKYYCWMYLPSPRPNQAVFLYNKALDQITKRLWVLPDAKTMAILASTDLIVDKKYETMQAWSVAFFKGTFWEFIRHMHGIDMLSEHEYFLAHREELIKAGCKIPNTNFAEPFDFSKIGVKQVINTHKTIFKK
jgi:hypothetical protein